MVNRLKNIIVLFNSFDLASMNIKLNLEKFDLLSKYSNVKYIELNKNILDLENNEFKNILKRNGFSENDLSDSVKHFSIITASKHCSEKNTNSLTVHSVGLLNKKELSYSDPFMQSLLLKNLSKFYKINEHKFFSEIKFNVTFEATHHTPVLELPMTFIEIGSTENEWTNEFCGEIIAYTIQKSISEYNDIFNCDNNFESSSEQKFIEKSKMNNFNLAVGIGGPHYCPNFTKFILDDSKNDFFIGHIIAKYNLEFLNYDLLLNILNKSFFNNDSLSIKNDFIKFYIILDWKGLSKEKEKILDIIEEIKRTSKFSNLEIIKIK